MTHPTMPAGFNGLLANICQAFGIPAISVSVIKDGQLIYSGGSGVTQLGGNVLADGNTIYQIASLAKSFTVAAIQLLIKEEKIKSWNDKIREYLPLFAMSVPHVAGDRTLRDAATHTLGLLTGGGDIYWRALTPLSRQQIVSNITLLEMERPHHPEHAYNNLGYILLGLVIEKASGMSWEQFISTRLLTPLGMTSTYVSLKDVKGVLAHPHLPVGGVLRPETPIDFSNERPAGGMWSSVENLAEWALFLLNLGKLHDGTQLLSEDAVWEMMAPAVVTPNARLPDNHPLKPWQSMFRTYCLGLTSRDYRRRKTVFHAGWNHGYQGIMFLVPEENLAVVVQSNGEVAGGMACLVPVYHVVDHFLGAPQHDWLNALLTFKQQLEQKAAVDFQKAMKQRDLSMRPTYPPSQYVCKLTAEGFGHVIVGQDTSGLTLEINPSVWLNGALMPFRGDTFLCEWKADWLREAAPALVTFHFDNGVLLGITIKLLSDSSDSSFSFADLIIRP